MKKVILSIIGVVVILVGGFIGYLVYDNHQKEVAQQQAEKDYKTNFENDGVDTSSDKATTTTTTPSTMNLDEVQAIFQQHIGKDLTPDQGKLLAVGYDMTPMGNHQYVYRAKSSQDYLLVTFNDNETSVTKVEKD